MKVLVTGGCGFLGSNLASSFINSGEEVYVVDSLIRKGSTENMQWLLQHSSTKGSLKICNFDIADPDKVDSFFRDNGPFNYICHVAGQVAMTTSLKDPRKDFNTNILGTFNILESLRKYSPTSLIAYSSTNKVYGDLNWLTYNEMPKRYIIEEHPKGLNEDIPLDFTTPYGCSKGAAEQYVKDWGKTYGLNTVIFRHSSIYGGRQFASIDQGWIGWFCQQALEQEKDKINKKVSQPFTISGTGKQVRDVLHANDLVNLYRKAYKHKNKLNGEVFNIGGGYSNSLSLLELFEFLESYLDIPKLIYIKNQRRKSDQDVFIASIDKVRDFLNWEPSIGYEEGISEMVKWCRVLKEK